MNALDNVLNNMADFTNHVASFVVGTQDEKDPQSSPSLRLGKLSWEITKKVAKTALIIFAALALTAIYPFNANILFVGGVIGLTSEPNSWIRRSVTKLTGNTAPANVAKALLATLLFLPPATMVGSFFLGAYVGINMAKADEDAAAAALQQAVQAM